MILEIQISEYYTNVFVNIMILNFSYKMIVQINTSFMNSHFYVTITLTFIHLYFFLIFAILMLF